MERGLRMITKSKTEQVFYLHRYDPAWFSGWTPECITTLFSLSSSCTVWSSETLSPVLLQVSSLVIIGWLHGNGSDVRLFASFEPLLSLLAAALTAELCIWVVIKASRLIRAGGSWGFFFFYQILTFVRLSALSVFFLGNENDVT